MCRLLGRTSHRINKAKRVNLSFELSVGRNSGGQRSYWQRCFEAFVDALYGRVYVYKLLIKLDKYYMEPDSTAFNYVYIYVDSTIWHDDMKFLEFLKSIFYIGRGVGCRFVDHARDTQQMLEATIDGARVCFCLFPV
jgi:hypothetical protein